MRFHIVSENTVAGADVDGVDLVAVNERVLRHNVFNSGGSELDKPKR